MLLSVTLSRPIGESPLFRSERAETPPSLVRAALSGDRAAFGRLHDDHAPLVHAILLARVPVDAADDLVQDVFLHAMRKLPALRDPASFGPWIAAIARRFAMQYHRRRRGVRRGAAPLPDGLADRRDLPAGDGDMIAEEARQTLAEIRGLPEAYRETLILRLVEGLSGPQIALRTGLTPGSVRVNLHRGMSLLRQRLDLESQS